MKELPILEQTTKVQPSLGSSNFGSAFAEVAKADLQVAQFGAEIAQNSAIQRAKLAGIEAGKNPTKKDILSFTKTDEAYAQAYKQEAFSTLDFKGKQFINDMYTEISQNPTRDGLSTFKDSSLKTIEELAANAPKDLEGDLRRSLEGTAMNNFYSLYNSWNSKERANIADTLMNNVNVALEEVFNSASEGDTKSSNQVNDMVIRSLQAGVDQGIIKPSTVEEYKRTYEQTVNNGRAADELERAPNKETYLAEMKEKPWIKNLTTTQRDAVISNTVNRYNQTQAALGAQQGINYVNYQTKIATGQMTPGDWLQANDKVNGQQFAQLKYKQATMVAEGAAESKLLAQASQYATDGAFLGAQYTDGQKEKIHNGLSKIKASEAGVNPEELSFKERTLGSLGMHMASPRLNREANSTYRYGTLNQIKEVADAVEGAKFAGNPELFSDLTPESMVMSKIVNQIGFIGDEAEANKRLKEIREGIYNTTPEQKAEGKAQVNAYYKDNEFNDPALKSKHILKGLKKELGRDFFGGAKLPNELSAVYDNLMNAYTPMTNDPEIANDISMDIIKKGFTRTRINGRDEYMPLAPEQLIPASPIMIENNKKLAVARLVKYNEELRSKGAGYIDKIEWPDMPSSGNPFENKIWGNSGDIILNINGNPSKVIVKSDLMTQKGVQQGAPNWALYIQDADKPNAPELPLYFSDRPGVAQARWFPIMRESEALTVPQIKKVLEAMKIKKVEIDKRPKESSLNPVLTLGGGL